MIPKTLLYIAIDNGYEQYADSSNWKEIANDPLFWEALSKHFKELDDKIN